MSSNRRAYLWAIALAAGLESVPKIEPQGGKLGLLGRLRAYNHGPAQRRCHVYRNLYWCYRALRSFWCRLQGYLETTSRLLLATICPPTYGMPRAGQVPRASDGVHT